LIISVFENEAIGSVKKLVKESFWPDVANTFPKPCVRNGKAIFIDESGFRLTHRRNDGRTKVGTRPVLVVPRIKLKNLTVGQLWLQCRVLEWSTSKFSKAMAILRIFWRFSESYSNDWLILEERIAFL
jgi:hypothetical protein